MCCFNVLANCLLESFMLESLMECHFIDNIELVQMMTSNLNYDPIITILVVVSNAFFFKVKCFPHEQLSTSS